MRISNGLMTQRVVYRKVKMTRKDFTVKRVKNEDVKARINDNINQNLQIRR